MRLVMAVAAAAVLANSFSPARLWDGKTPDFRGIWQASGTAYVNVESIVVDPPDGKIPYRPEALAKRNENYRRRATADPSIKCYQAGVPRATYLGTPLQILQSPGNFAIVYQENHAFRVFHPDTRPHFDNTDWWMGDTRYRWDGDTLVADVVAQTDEAWLDQAGNFHSTDVHIVERYRLTGADTLEYEARIEDPVVYTKPWTLRTTLHRVKQAGARIIEDECLEDANGVRHHISPSDPRNLLKSDYSRWTQRPAKVAAQAASIQMNLLADWASQKDTLMKIAAAMPEDRFGYKPTPPQRNYGEQILHIAEANVNQMKRLGSKETAPVIDMKATSRAVILKALEDSFDYGTAVIKEQTDQTMLQAAAETRFDPFRGVSTRARVVSFVMGHTWDIYGQMVVYLRLNGVTPPASQRP